MQAALKAKNEELGTISRATVLPTTFGGAGDATPLAMPITKVLANAGGAEPAGVRKSVFDSLTALPSNRKMVTALLPASTSAAAGAGGVALGSLTVRAVRPMPGVPVLTGCATDPARGRTANRNPEPSAARLNLGGSILPGHKPTVGSLSGPSQDGTVPMVLDVEHLAGSVRTHSADVSLSGHHAELAAPVSNVVRTHSAPELAGLGRHYVEWEGLATIISMAAAKKGIVLSDSEGALLLAVAAAAGGEPAEGSVPPRSTGTPPPGFVAGTSGETAEGSVLPRSTGTPPPGFAAEMGDNVTTIISALVTTEYNGTEGVAAPACS